jgi:ABC-type lipoprotein release transport system permease subunit
MTAERMRETEKLEKEMEKIVGDLDMNEEDIEKMFSEGKRSIVTASGSRGISDKIDKKDRVNVLELEYTDEQMEDGMCLNIAVILKDPSKIKKTIVEIEKLNLEHKLNIKTLNWLDASGTLGQFTFAMKVILYIFIGIIFLVAVFIIMNSMLMATMERTKEIGTMRAMGAQKNYVLKLILAETSLLSSLFGLFGIFMGLMVVIFFHYFGVPAGTSKIFLFLFSGPRLYLSIEMVYVLAVLVLIVFVSLLSSYYPARKAASVPPITAMQKGE